MVWKPEVQAMIESAKSGNETDVLKTVFFYQLMMDKARKVGDSFLYSDCSNEFAYWKEIMTNACPAAYEFWKSKQATCPLDVR